MINNWKKINSQEMADYAIFRSRIDTSISPRTGRQHRFVVLESPDWINVIPLTPAGNVILIHQYRHGIEERVVEVPGGMVEPTEPDPIAAARRELLEETGYQPGQILPIGQVTPNPAFLNNRCYSYVAFGCCLVQQPEFDGAEDIAVEEVPLAAIPEMIASGRISHALTIAAFYFLDQFRQQHPDLFAFKTT